MLNRLHTIAFFSAFVSLLLLARTEGSTITWTNNVGGYGSTITGVSDIPTSGTYVDGVYFGDDWRPDCRHRCFSSSDLYSGLCYRSESVRRHQPRLPKGRCPRGGRNFAERLWNGFRHSQIRQRPIDAGLSITFSNLFAHENYQAQFWVSDNDGTNYQMSLTAGNSILLKAELSSTAGSPGQFALGTFGTALIGSETLTLNFFAGPGAYTFLNAIALHDLGTNVPEPGSIVLMLLGVTGLCIAARRRAMAK